jgi:lipopolysaccharide exporter
VAVRSHWLPALHFRRTDLSGFLQFGLFQMGERSLNYLSNNVDYLIIGRFLGSEPLGYYTLAYNLMRMPSSYVNPVVVSVAFPAFARVQEQNDLLRRGYAKILHYLSAVNFPIMAGMFVVAPLFVPLIYGSQWLPAVPVVQIFCLLGALKSLGNPLGSLLLAKGRADLGFWMNLTAMVGYGISNVIGTRWGIGGVAASSLIFSTLVLLPVDFYLRWLTIRMSVREFWQAIRQSTVAALGMLVAILPLSYVVRLVNHDVVALLILVLSGAIVYGILIRRLDHPLLTEVWGYLKPTSLPKV